MHLEMKQKLPKCLHLLSRQGLTGTESPLRGQRILGRQFLPVATHWGHGLSVFQLLVGQTRIYLARNHKWTDRFNWPNHAPFIADGYQPLRAVCSHGWWGNWHCPQWANGCGHQVGRPRLHHLRNCLGFIFDAVKLIKFYQRYSICLKVFSKKWLTVVVKLHRPCKHFAQPDGQYAMPPSLVSLKITRYWYWCWKGFSRGVMSTLPKQEAF